jgi:hypothetical protein
VNFFGHLEACHAFEQAAEQKPMLRTFSPAMPFLPTSNIRCRRSRSLETDMRRTLLLWGLIAFSVLQVSWLTADPLVVWRPNVTAWEVTLRRFVTIQGR